MLHRAMLLVVAAGAGAVTAAGFPPTDLAVLAVVGAAAGLWIAARASTPGSAALHGLAYSLAFYVVLFAWSARFGPVAYGVLVVIQAAFWIPIAIVASRLRRHSSLVWVAAVTSTWVVAEAARSRMPLGGFEWGQLGVTAHSNLLGSAAAIVGTLGTTALLVAVAATVAVVADRRDAAMPRQLAPLSVVGFVVLAAAALGSITFTQPSGTLGVAVVQADPVCPGEYSVDCPGEREELLRRLGTSTAALPHGLDLVVWGEGTLSAPTPGAAGESVIEQLGSLPAPLIAGVTSPASTHQFFNRNVLYDTEGQVLGAYTKRQPVPFGEYVPARQHLGGIAEVGRLVPRDMVRGEGPRWLELDTAALGTLSSWEVTFSRLARDAGRHGDALVVVTTQSTYERAAVSDQLLRTAQMRAHELQRPVIVAATTGRSAVIDAAGRRHGTTRLYGADTLVETVELRQGTTPFVRYGDTPVIVLALATLAAIGARSRWRDRTISPRQRQGRRAAPACRT